MNLIYWLEQIQPSERHLVGEKAWYLSQLGQLGYPIIPGFVVSATTLQDFLAILGNTEPLLADLPYSSLHIDVNHAKTLQNVARRARQEILGASLPETWLNQLWTEAQKLNAAVLILRASVGLGEMTESSKYIAGFPYNSPICYCKPQALIMALKQAWAELFYARSLFYWQKLGIGLEKINLAILVQPLQEAIASGSALIQDKTLSIYATFGLEQALIKGEVNPDFYQIELATSKVKTKQLGNKNWAYRPKIGDLSSANYFDCLETYFLDEPEQEQYVLDDINLNKIINLIQSLYQKKPNLHYLEWVLISETTTTELKYYFLETRFQSYQAIPVSIIQKPPLMLSRKLILKGLPASQGQAIALAEVIVNHKQTSINITSGKIIIAKNILPEWLPFLKSAAAIIAEEGGMTSHGAIIARELGIPAIVGATEATKLIKNGDLLLLNGDTGELYYADDNASISVNKFVISNPSLPTINYPEPLATKLLVNLSQISSLNKVQNLPVDGIGLLRSELMLLEVSAPAPLRQWLQHTSKSILVAKLEDLITEFAGSFAPRPVFYRALDLESSQLLDHNLDKAINQSLGKRGTYSYSFDPSFFELELEAIARVRAAGYTNLHLLLPFVRSVEEFRFCRDYAAKKGLIQQNNFQLWIMAEVPSVLFLLSKYVAAGVQGISIGTNDLTQLILGANREQGELATKYNVLHPAMLTVLQQLIETANQLQISCSICGQAPVEYPELIDYLVRWGITSISVEPNSVNTTYRLIARAEKKLILEAARLKLK